MTLEKAQTELGHSCKTLLVPFCRSLPAGRKSLCTTIQGREQQRCEGSPASLHIGIVHDFPPCVPALLLLFKLPAHFSAVPSWSAFTRCLQDADPEGSLTVFGMAEDALELFSALGLERPNVLVRRTCWLHCVHQSPWVGPYCCTLGGM